mgnify:CR=1 FL=1
MKRTKYIYFTYYFSSSLKFWKNHIFRRDYLIQQEGQYKGAPLRTKAGGRWLNGYSDHLPVVMYLVKEKSRKW